MTVAGDPRLPEQPGQDGRTAWSQSPGLASHLAKGFKTVPRQTRCLAQQENSLRGPPLRASALSSCLKALVTSQRPTVPRPAERRSRTASPAGTSQSDRAAGSAGAALAGALYPAVGVGSSGGHWDRTGDA